MHSLAKKFHIIPASAPDVESGGYSQLPGGARAEAERRRQVHLIAWSTLPSFVDIANRAMALKALDQRLATSVPAQASRTGNTGQNNVATSIPRPAPSQADATHTLSSEDSLEQESTATSGGDKGKAKAREEAQ